MQDYKNNKVLELKKEMVKVPNQTDYEINGIDTSRAIYFYRKEKEKFKIIPRGSYTIVDEASNKYLRITDSNLLGEAIEFQVCYLFVKTSSSYIDDFPEIVLLQEHYNQLYEDFNNLLQQLQSNNILGDTLKMSYVLPQLNEGQVWVLRQGEMVAEDIFDLDSRIKEAFETFKLLFSKWVDNTEKPRIDAYIDEKLQIANDEINSKTELEKIELDDYTEQKKNELDIYASGRKPLQYGTIAELQASPNLKINDFVDVAGYYTVGDGAGHKRVIAQTDDGSGVQLANGLWANIVHNGEVNVSWLGAKGDGVTDVSEVVKKIEAFSNDIVVIFSSGKFKVNTHLVIKNKIKVISSIFLVDWTPDSWLTLYNQEFVLPEWFGIKFSDSLTDDEKLNNCKSIQGALNTAIDISIDPIGITPVSNHGMYNSVNVLIDNGKEYFIGDNSIEILSEHHFLGVTIQGESGKYNGGIKGDGLGTLIDIKEPLNSSSIGAQTCKTIKNLGLGKCKVAIKGRKIDQSFYIKGNRFTQCSEKAVELDVVDNVFFLENFFVDCAGGYLFYATNINSSIIANNTTGESVSESLGIHVVTGIERGGVNVKGNVLRGGYILVNANGATDKTTCIIEGNTIYNSNNRFSNNIINIEPNAKGAICTNNTIIFGSKTKQEEFVAIKNIRGNTCGNTINGDFDIGMYIESGFCNDTITGCKTGIKSNAQIDENTLPLKITSTVDSCDIGMDINTLYASLEGCVIKRSKTLGVKGGSNYRMGTLKNCTFYKNTKDYELYHPADYRIGEYIIPNNCTFLSSEYTYKIRDGLNLVATLNADISIPPAGGTWKSGDRIIKTDGSYFLCTVSGTPGQWLTKANSIGISELNTPYHVEKMKSEGVYNDFIVYMDEKTAYDNQQREKEKAMQLAYEEALKENPNLTYEEFVATRPATFVRRKRSLEIQEPVPSQALLEFKERYLG